MLLYCRIVTALMIWWRNNASSFDWNNFYTYYLELCLYVFRAMLYGGLMESQPGISEVQLQDTSAKAFESLLKYIYTGKMNLIEIKVSFQGNDSRVDQLTLSAIFPLNFDQIICCDHLLCRSLQDVSYKCSQHSKKISKKVKYSKKHTIEYL